MGLPFVPTLFGSITYILLLIVVVVVVVFCIFVMYGN